MRKVFHKLFGWLFEKENYSGPTYTISAEDIYFNEVKHKYGKKFEEVVLRNGHIYIFARVQSPRYGSVFHYVQKINSELYGIGFFPTSAEKFNTIEEAEKAADIAIRYEFDQYLNEVVSRKEIIGM